MDMEKLKQLLEDLGYTTRKGIGWEFEIFAFDTDGNSVTCLLYSETISAVSNRDVETQSTPEYFEANLNDKDAVVAAIHNAMNKDRNLK